MSALRDASSSTSPSSVKLRLSSSRHFARLSTRCFALVRKRLLYLAVVTTYLGAVTGLIAAWQKLVAVPEEKVGFTIYVVAGLLALPLLFALLFNLLPTIRRRRERDLRPVGAGRTGYFTTAPREDDPDQLFARGYEPFLEWARKPKAALLHLTGLSGSGKSSLLSAYLKPRLAAIPGERTRLLAVRSYHDPLLALKDALLPLWQKRPANYAALAPLEALRRASHQLDRNERLLIALDQFEEFFLLRATVPEAPARSGAGTPLPPAATVAEGELTPLRDFLRAFLADPPECVTLLLSYREDHRRLLAPLELPARREKENWLTVDPLDFAAAAGFLRSCPGLTVPTDRMNRVLREAARQESGRVVMRPIVANFLGLILQKMSAHPTLWRRSGDLLRGYVRDCLGEELREERARVLRALLTDFHTARPRSVAEIARETGLDAAKLDAQLEHFGRAGLLRCVNGAETHPGRRVWQIAHDFLATLIERVLDGLHRTLWRHVRPWLAPVAVVLVIGVGFVWPWVEKQQAISLLANEGFTWNQEKAAIVVGTYEGRKTTKLDHLARAVRRLNPSVFDLTGCDALRDVDGLAGLAALQSVNLPDCQALENLDGLRGLTALQSLNLGNCQMLRNVDGLRNLAALQSLSLRGCQTLQDVNVLSGLTALQGLDLSGCQALRNVDGLKRLTALKNVNLADCRALENLDGLRGLIFLQDVDLSNCITLRDVDGLADLTALQNLGLRGCWELQNVDGLAQLTMLPHLVLSGCRALQNVDGLKRLTNLQDLDLSGCDTLQNVDGLVGLTSLRSLSLRGCRTLQSVDGLKGLIALKRLILAGSHKLPKENWPILAAALPHTAITFPDGSGAFGR